MLRSKVLLSDEYLLEIGKIMARWSHLEQTLQLCLIALTSLESDDIVSWVLFNHMTVPQKIDLFGALCGHLVDSHPRLKDYESVKKALNDAQLGRNKIVHARWSVDPETGATEIAHLSARGKIKTEILPFPIDKLRAIDSQIGATVESLYKLVLARP